MTGTILAIANGKITLSPGNILSKEGCFGCMRQECKNRRTVITATNPLALPLGIGQTVEIHTPKQAALRQALQALLPLIGGFIAGFILGGILFPQSGETFRAGCGVFALFAAAFLTYMLRKRFPAAVLPQVIGVCDTPPHAVGCPEKPDADAGLWP